MTEIVTARARPGAGIFTASLRRALQGHGLPVPFVEHDLRAEMAGHHDLPVGLRELLGEETAGLR